MFKSDLKDKLINVIAKLCNEYRYIKFSDSELNLIIADCLKYVKKDEDYEEFLKKYFYLIVKQKNKSKENRIFYFNKYIEINNKKFEKNVSEINKLQLVVEFFRKINYIPDFKFCEIILENDLIKSLIEKVVKDNLDLIKKDKIHQITQDELVLLLIDAYCIVNNIEKEEIDNIDVDFDDNLKIYLQSIPKKVLTLEEEQKLGYKILEGNKEAINELVLRNLGLVIRLSKRYCNKGLEFLDLIQEGNLGLIRAASKFDVTKGYRFTTYASYFVNSFIIRAIDNKARIIRIPAYLSQKINTYYQKKEEFRKKYGYYPDDEDMASLYDFTLSEASKCGNIFATVGSVGSINQFLNDADVTIEDVIPASNDGIEPDVINSIGKEQLFKLIKQCNLSDIDIEVIKLRYGYYDECWTFEEIAKIYGVTRQAINSRVKKIIKRIQKNDNIYKIAEFTNNPKECLKIIGK